MLDQTTRTTILKLHEAGHGTRTIARTLHVSRNVVKRVIDSRSAEPPPFTRGDKAEPYRDATRSSSFWSAAKETSCAYTRSSPL